MGELLLPQSSTMCKPSSCKRRERERQRNGSCGGSSYISGEVGEREYKFCENCIGKRKQYEGGRLNHFFNK